MSLLLRILLRPLKWVARGGDAISVATRLMVVAMVAGVALAVVGSVAHGAHNLLHAASNPPAASGNHAGTTSGGWHPGVILVALCLAALVAALAAVLLFAVVRRERERRAGDPEWPLRHHGHLAATLLVAGTVAGAVPSGLPGPWWVRSVVTIAAVGSLWSWGWRSAGAQVGSEPPWRAGLRLGARRGVRLAREGRYVEAPWLWVPAAALASAGLVACCAAGVYGGDCGIILAAGVLTWWTWGLGRRASEEARQWWGRARSAAGAADVARVWVRPDWIDAGTPWGADVILTRGHEAPAVERAGEVLSGLLGRDWDVSPRPIGRRLQARHVGVLPDLALMPTAVTSGIHELPLGQARGGREVVFDTEADPHALICGKTGSGKTVAIAVLAAEALLRGWELAVVETVKGGLDYRALEPWCRLAAWDLEMAALAVEAVYSEVEDRRQLLLDHRAVKMADLPETVRRPPMLVVLDEYFSMVVPNKLKTEDAKATNDLKARIAGTVGKLMREARFADIHVILGMQRPDAGVFEGEVKANTGMRVLAGSADRIARSMALRDPEGAPVVAKKRLGRVIVETESEDAEEVQCYLGVMVRGPKDPPDAPVIPDILRQAGVEGPIKRPSPAPPPGPVIPNGESGDRIHRPESPQRSKRRRVLVADVGALDGPPPPLPE